ncbi:MAG: FtsX-like permease family protein [Desulfobacteraceae bacterium]|nr:MAG: FtsX-like permease family protein [Desulfobacteraceae bacterium]
MENLYKTIGYLKISLNSLRCNKLRSFLSMIGVVFGVMAVIVIVSVGEGAKAEALRQIERLGTRNIYVKSVGLAKDRKEDLIKTHLSGVSAQDIPRIQNGCAFVKNIAAIKEIPVSVIGALKEITPQIIAVSPSYADILNLKLTSGRFINRTDISGHHLVCVAGAHIAAQLGDDGAVGSHVRIGDQLFKIIGILNPYDIRSVKSSSESSAVSERNYNNIILIPINGEQWVTPDFSAEDSTGDFSELIVQVDQTEHVMASSKIIREIMAVNHQGVDDYQIVTPLELLNQSQKTNELFSLLLAAIASVSLLVGGIGIMNIMLASVSERKREIGIRRAVGAKQKHILMQFLAEASLLTVSGGAIGIIGGLITVYIMKYTAPWELVITVKAILLPLVISSLTGIFFGSYPAYKAARLDPTHALMG